MVLSTSRILIGTFRPMPASARLADDQRTRGLPIHENRLATAHDEAAAAPNQPRSHGPTIQRVYRRFAQEVPTTASASVRPRSDQGSTQGAHAIPRRQARTV